MSTTAIVLLIIVAGIVLTLIFTRIVLPLFAKKDPNQHSWGGDL